MNLRQSFLIVGGFVALLWLVFMVDGLLGLDLYRYGVYPRRIDGLAGVLFGPLIHSSFSHIFSNTLPILVLGIAVLHGYPRSSRFVIPII